MCYSSVWPEHHEVLKSLLLQGNLLRGLGGKRREVLWALLNRQGCHLRGERAVLGGVLDTLLQPKERKEGLHSKPGELWYKPLVAGPRAPMATKIALCSSPILLF